MEEHKCNCKETIKSLEDENEALRIKLSNSIELPRIEILESTFEQWDYLIYYLDDKDRLQSTVSAHSFPTREMAIEKAEEVKKELLNEKIKL